MEFYDSGEQVTKDCLERFEKKMGLSFPTDYKDFMMRVNGGTPEDLVFNFIDVITNKTNSSDLRELFVFYEEQEDDSFDNIYQIYNTMVEEKTIPPFFLPIGDDSGGNPICMNLSQNEYGSIWFCAHELENKETGYLASSKIANSFTEFLDGLNPLSLENKIQADEADGSSHG